MTCRLLRVATALVLSASLTGAAEGGEMRVYPTPYYVIHSDLDGDLVREAAARVTAMAEEYHQRTKSFAGSIRKKFDFYLFARPQDYQAAGGRPGSPGMYVAQGRDGKLLVLAVSRGDLLWYIIQHEGFHQFVQQVIGENVPLWLNEGLAEYFGVAQWTGDAFVTGWMPPDKVARVKFYIRTGQILSFDKMLTLSNTDWRNRRDTLHYDQAWSMVHFLVHGMEGRFQPGFSAFIDSLGRGRDWKTAWTGNLPNLPILHKRYDEWWQAQDVGTGRLLWRKAMVATLTSYLARAHLQGLEFQTADDLFAAARAGRIENKPDTWLPPSLLERTLKKAAAHSPWTLDTKRQTPALVLELTDGTILRGSFSATKGRIKTDVDIKPPAKPPAKPRQNATEPSR